MASMEFIRNAALPAGMHKVKSKITAVLIDGVHTDVVLIDYINRLFVALTQYKKLGSFITVYKEASRTINGVADVYHVRTIQGCENDDWELLCRHLAEHTHMPKPVLFSVALKNADMKTVKLLREVILKNKIW